jgi:FixJ family two-component response regulator
VVALIVRGCSNREIAEELVIAEGTAVRHVARGVPADRAIRGHAEAEGAAVDAVDDLWVA